MPEEQFDLSRTVEDVIKAFAAEADRRGIELIFSNTFTRPGHLLGDSRRFREVVSHLVNNAFQHAGEGSIKVNVRSVSQSDDVVMIELAVEDTASGMSEKNLDDLFHYFELIADDFEVEEASDPPTEILSIKIGLGLAVVSRFVRNTKGHLRIRSQLGKGTVVAIIIPFRIAKDLPRRQSMSQITNSQGRLPVGFGSRGSSTTGIDERTSLTRPLGIPGYPPNISYVGASMSSPPLLAQMLHPNVSEPRSETTSSSDPTSADLLSHYQDRYPFPNVSSGSEQKPSRHLSILIAEDNPINSRMLEHRLSKLGHVVQVATNGQACVDMFEASPNTFDVILVSPSLLLIRRESAKPPPISLFAGISTIPRTSRLTNMLDADRWTSKCLSSTGSRLQSAFARARLEPKTPYNHLMCIRLYPSSPSPHLSKNHAKTNTHGKVLMDGCSSRSTSDAWI